MTTYEIQPTSTVYMDGTGKYTIRRKGVPGAVAAFRMGLGDGEELAKFLNEQARLAWEEGRKAGSESTVQPNPYTTEAQAQVNGL